MSQCQCQPLTPQMLLIPNMVYSAVLKAILQDISLNAAVVPCLLKLSRHEDTQIRKLVYAAFAKHVEEEDGEGVKLSGPTHPSKLPMGTMERLIETGLWDREDAVKQAAVSLVESWITAFEHSTGSSTEGAVISLLRLFKVHKRTSLQMHVVEVLIEGIFEARRDILQNFTFDGEFLKHMFIQSLTVCPQSLIFGDGWGLRRLFYPGCS